MLQEVKKVEAQLEELRVLGVEFVGGLKTDLKFQKVVNTVRGYIKDHFEDDTSDITKGAVLTTIILALPEDLRKYVSLYGNFLKFDMLVDFREQVEKSKESAFRELEKSFDKITNDAIASSNRLFERTKQKLTELCK